MNSYQVLQQKYEVLGLKELKVEDIGDIEKIYNIYPLQVVGYEELTADQQEEYKTFIINFYNGWGLEAREDIKPLSIKHIKDEDYLRIDYKIGNRKEWLHILKNGEWY